MIDVSTDLKKAIAEQGDKAGVVKALLVTKMAEQLVDFALEFAPDASDYTEAMHAEGRPDCFHALLEAEELFKPLFQNMPELIDIIRHSVEWSPGERPDPASCAAHALATEAYGYGTAEALWNERRATAAPSI